ncbi:MAG: hypothetical protein K0U68_10000 [Gammaproteobacteria bacterium]|nr:hypothetical protein [Gammaproteobacteria bacterium]
MSECVQICFPEPQRIMTISKLERQLELLIPRDLAYVNGHFEQLSIVPGVTQVHWAVHYARQCFSNCDNSANTDRFSNDSTNKQLLTGFYQMQSVKFKRLMTPECAVSLDLRVTDSFQKLYFKFYTDDQEFSSGRLYFNPHAN